MFSQSAGALKFRGSGEPRKLTILKDLLDDLCERLSITSARLGE
ncbi:MAG: hypothetical protein U0836_11795 [Pirellulales bacterium]